MGGIHVRLDLEDESAEAGSEGIDCLSRRGVAGAWRRSEGDEGGEELVDALLVPRRPEEGGRQFPAQDTAVVEGVAGVLEQFDVLGELALELLRIGNAAGRRLGQIRDDVP